MKLNLIYMVLVCMAIKLFFVLSLRNIFLPVESRIGLKTKVFEITGENQCLKFV